MALKQQLEEVRRRLAEAEIASEETSESEIVVRAEHNDVGDIVIRSDDCELTLAIGSHFHQHFRVQGASESPFDDAGRFVVDFVNDRIVVTVKYSGSRPVSARIESTETGESSIVVFPTEKRTLWSRLVSSFYSPRETTKSFKWSGPILTQESPASADDDGMSDLADRLSQLTPSEMVELAKYLEHRNAGEEANESDSKE